MQAATIRRLALAAAIMLGAEGVAAAQPIRLHGHDGTDVVMAIARLKTRLDLNTSQQVMWDSAVAAGKSARGAMRTNRDNVRAVLNAELAKAEPDLAAVAAAADEDRTQATALHRQARDAWLGLYATFTPGQKAVVTTAIRNQLARIDQRRAKMLEHHAPRQ